MDTIRSVDTIFNKIHGIVNTIRSVGTIFNEIHGIVGIIRSVDTDLRFVGTGGTGSPVKFFLTV